MGITEIISAVTNHTTATFVPTSTTSSSTTSLPEEATMTSTPLPLVAVTLTPTSPTVPLSSTPSGGSATSATSMKTETWMTSASTATSADTSTAAPWRAAETGISTAHWGKTPSTDSWNQTTASMTFANMTSGDVTWEEWTSNWTAESLNGTAGPNSTIICSNDYCISDDDYVDMILAYLNPKPFEWLLIMAYVVTFSVGLVGNFLVCFAVWRNHSMRTVTNYFIVNLAVADLMVILICLPPTVLGDITETWFMGSIMCKIVKYLQGVSVSVSVLTLTSISVERWYAICYPLLFKSTPHRARIIIVVIWVASLLLMLPEMIVVDTHPHKPEVTILFTSCKPTWSDNRQAAFQLFLVVTVYCLPFMLMFLTYFQIARCLWSTKIPSETSRDQSKSHDNNSSQASHNQLVSRRKAAKMLMCVVLMFGTCYLPVHLLNIFRYAGVLDDLTQSEATYFALVAHWICYFNSAINPVIYNFMSAKFRKEFANACTCCCRCCGLGNGCCRRAAANNRGTAMYSYRYTNTFRVQNTRENTQSSQRSCMSSVRHHPLTVCT